MKSSFHVSLPNLLAPSVGLPLWPKSDKSEENRISTAISHLELCEGDVYPTEDRNANNNKGFKRSDSITSFVKYKLKDRNKQEDYPTQVKVLMVDLMDVFSSPTEPVQNLAGDYFTQNFWGEKNHGFDMLYHNMKHGQISIKDLQDIIKESATVEETYAKHMTKLAKQVTNCSHLGTFAPLLDVLKCMAEKLSSCHMDIAHKLHDIIKDLGKYLEEQKNKHKHMKDELSGTAESLQNIQSVTSSVSKSKEKYNQFCVEAEKLRRQNALPKDIEKALVKSNKAADEYKGYVKKYATVRTEFEKRMTESTKKFQSIEEEHLRHMKSVLDAYILSFENSNVLIGQVHEEFRRQTDEKTIDSLIKQYSEQKGTGIERPGPIEFEECDVNAILSTLENGNVTTATSEAPAPPPVKAKKESGGGMLSGLRIHRRRNNKKDGSGSVHSKDNDSKDAESIESPDKEPSLMVDDEGYSIRPENAAETRKSFKLSSSDSDSDSDSEDEQRARKIQVRIKPKETANVDSAGSDLETLNAVTRNLTLASPTPLGTKKPVQTISTSVPDTSISVPPPQNTVQKSSNHEILDLFGSAPTTQNPPQKSSSYNDMLVDLLHNDSAKTGNEPARSDSKKGKAPPPPFKSPDSTKSLDSKGLSAASGSESDTPPPRPPKPASMIVPEDNSRPTLLQLNQPNQPSPAAPLASSESWSSLSSMGTGVGRETPVLTPMDSFNSSRGPSPLTLSSADPIPIAVALTETVNALFKGADESRCLIKTTGDMQISFPAGITRALTSNPNPAILTFKMKCDPNRINNIKHNQNLLQSEIKDAPDGYIFTFDMRLLVAHIKKLTDAQPNNPHYNVHVISYQVTMTHSQLPLHLSSYWKCENTTTDLRVDLKYNNKVTTSLLRNVNIIVPVNGGVINHLSKPNAEWRASQNRILWRLPSLGNENEHPMVLRSRLTLSSGPSHPSPLAVQFLSEGSTLSHAGFELDGFGYRLSLVKKMFITGKYMAEHS